MTKLLKVLTALGLIFAMGALVSRAQTTEFTYQGKLTDNNSAPTAGYDFEFSLFSTNTGGTAISTIQRPGVSVANGIFTVSLDFGAQFDGTARFLEIAVRPGGSTGGFQQLLPRQAITSAPYAVRSLNATNADAAITAVTATTANNSLQLGGLAASQFVQTNDSRLSDARNPLAGSTNYIQNRTTPQTLTNFNISGTGTANIFSAATQFNIGSNRVLLVNSVSGSNVPANSNTFVGVGTGAANMPDTDGAGSYNSFFGYNAGNSNTTARGNSFFGFNSGNNNTTGGDNTFFGYYSGEANTTGYFNTFIGNQAGLSNTTGRYNTFIGYGAGLNNKANEGNSFLGSFSGVNSTGGQNTIIGQSSGYNNTTGFGNTIIGYMAGFANTTGDSNTIIGNSANMSSANLNHATAIGADAVVSSSSTIALGRSDGSDTVDVPGKLQIDTLGTAGSTPLCLNASNRVGNCSSSLRYKTDVETFSGGLEIVRRLRPISFAWRDRPALRDVGFGAEEVEKIEPLLTFRNSAGAVEGVKYSQITTVLVNAVNEQQAQIEAQQKLLEEQHKQLIFQQKQIELLKKIVCQTNPEAELCKEQ